MKKYISILNVISAFAVVMLHMSGDCYWFFSKERYWIMGNIIQCIFYFAVPIFFMITGATLLDYPKRYGLKEYAKKRISRTFIPFIVWSLISYVYFCFRQSDYCNQITLKRLLEEKLSIVVD